MMLIPLDNLTVGVHWFAGMTQLYPIDAMIVCNLVSCNAGLNEQEQAELHRNQPHAVDHRDICRYTRQAEHGGVRDCPPFESTRSLDCWRVGGSLGPGILSSIGFCLSDFHLLEFAALSRAPFHP
mmetsp:Transcript_32492/g.50593  ORF Transcript_32492/g.50593 Transcript_32492/m.50593 type:complete len:125 (+) Transcript_32492:583-957(+)